MTSSPIPITPENSSARVLSEFPVDHRGSPVPTLAMIRTRVMELRKRRGLTIALVVVNIGIPAIFLAVRLIIHVVDPKSYGPAGGYGIFTNLVTGVMFIFGFIVAATLGCTAGSVDLSEGVFRHLVVTGRSRLALYFARIPAGLTILVPIVAVGFAIVCAVCVLAAPTQLHFDGAVVPQGLSEGGLVSWAKANPQEVVCNFNYRGPINVPVRCGPNGPVAINPQTGPPASTAVSTSQLATLAAAIAVQDYSSYHQTFLKPPYSLMAQSLLWLELETAIGYIVGLGLASLMGQRTVPVVLMIILEIVLTPLFATVNIPHLIDLQRAIVGVATVHVEPLGLPSAFSGHGNGGPTLVPESTSTAIVVIVGWLVVWTGLGAWRMARRDV